MNENQAMINLRLKLDLRDLEREDRSFVSSERIRRSLASILSAKERGMNHVAEAWEKENEQQSKPENL